VGRLGWGIWWCEVLECFWGAWVWCGEEIDWEDVLLLDVYWYRYQVENATCFGVSVIAIWP
jgi:hypothetical protein